MPFNEATYGTYSTDGQMMGKDLGYSYPLGKDFRPGSELHTKVVGKLIDMAKESQRAIQSKHSSWRDVERSLTCYRPLDKDEDITRTQDYRRPVGIVVPMSYVNMETILAYLSSAFLQEPYLRYTGFSPEDVIGAILLEKVIERQCTWTRMGLSLYVMWRDFLAYGFGVAAPMWTVEKHMSTSYREVNKYGFFGLLGKEMQKFEKEKVVFEGNKLVNINPFNFRPDPSVQIHLYQEGSFCGWVARENYLELLTRERYGAEDLFNVRYLAQSRNERTGDFRNTEADRERTGSGEIAPLSANSIDVLYMYAKAIPQEWGLGPGRYPEKWLFALAGNKVLIRAQPLGLNHDRFPLVIAAPMFDGYTSTPISMIEMMAGAQQVLDHHFNTRLTALRKGLNGTTVVDPSMINVLDMRRPSTGGRIIRLRRKAFGQKVQDAIQQLDFADPTVNTMADVQQVIAFMRDVSGATESLQGIFRSRPERLTASEARDTRLSAMSRIETLAKLVSIMAMAELGYQCASNTVQLMTQDTYVKVVGRYEEELKQEFGADLQKNRGRMRVTPYQLAVEYDIEVHDGSVASSDFADIWAQIFQIVATTDNAEIMKRLDPVRIFKHWARLSGAKNLSDFERDPNMQLAPMQAQVLPDQQVQQMAERGNIAPLPEVA